MNNIKRTRGIKIELPTLELEVIKKDGKRELIKKRGVFETSLDLSINCQTRWENVFEEESKISGVFDYYKVCETIKDPVEKLGEILKSFYCFTTLYDEDMNFYEYSSLFTLADGEYTLELANTIKEYMELIYPDSKKKS